MEPGYVEVKAWIPQELAEIMTGKALSEKESFAKMAGQYILRGAECQRMHARR